MNGRHPSPSDVLRSHGATVHLTKKLHCTGCQRTTVQKKYDVWRCTEIGCAKPGQVECLAPVTPAPQRILGDSFGELGPQAEGMLDRFLDEARDRRELGGES